jgi:hypothetical protein
MTDEHTPPATTNSHFTRRTVVRTAAWTAPAITLVTAAPAFAAGASGFDPPVISVGDVSASAESFVQGTEFYTWAGDNNPTYSRVDQSAHPTYPSHISDPSVMVVKIDEVTLSPTDPAFSQYVTLSVAIDAQVGPDGETYFPVAQYGDTVQGAWDVGPASLSSDGLTTSFTFNSKVQLSNDTPSTGPLTFKVAAPDQTGDYVYKLRSQLNINVATFVPNVDDGNLGTGYTYLAIPTQLTVGTTSVTFTDYQAGTKFGYWNGPNDYSVIGPISPSSAHSQCVLIVTVSDVTVDGNDPGFGEPVTLTLTFDPTNIRSDGTKRPQGQYGDFASPGWTLNNDPVDDDDTDIVQFSFTNSNTSAGADLGGLTFSVVTTKQSGSQLPFQYNNIAISAVATADQVPDSNTSATTTSGLAEVT